MISATSADVSIQRGAISTPSPPFSVGSKAEGYFVASSRYSSSLRSDRTRIADAREALMFIKSGAGDATRALIAYSLIYMLPLSAKIPFNWRDLTPVSVMALDEFVLWDNTTLPYKTTKEFMDAAKTADPQFKMGGTGSKREDHVLTVFIEKKTSAKFAYLPYKSGGEAATELVGNHTASNVNNPSENLEVWRAGQ